MSPNPRPPLAVLPQTLSIPFHVASSVDRHPSLDQSSEDVLRAPFPSSHHDGLRRSIDPFRETRIRDDERADSCAERSRSRRPTLRGILRRRKPLEFDEMAALTAVTATPVVGLSGSSISGKKLAIKSARPVPMKAARSVGVATAKYDVESSLYFDLEDVGNTTGNWDLYGSDGLSPYNGLQSKFFQTFAGAFTKRGLLLKFLILGGAGALGYASTTADSKLLAIKKGPQQAPVMGPRGRM